ncbi:MAG: divergent PAP2 family protein [Spirochaetales bacterium]
METLASIIANPIFLSTVFAWFSAQFIKALISLVRNRAHGSKRDLLMTMVWTTGGMPSSHSSVVCALTTALGFQTGFDSPLFLTSLCFSALAIRDALGVRQAAGNLARTLNQVLPDLNTHLGTSYKPVKEIHGHKGSEVVVGMILGIFLAAAFCNL